MQEKNEVAIRIAVDYRGRAARQLSHSHPSASIELRSRISVSDLKGTMIVEFFARHWKGGVPAQNNFLKLQWKRSLHLVAAKVLVIQIFKPFSQLFIGASLGNRIGRFRIFQDLVFHVDRAVQA